MNHLGDAIRHDRRDVKTVFDLLGILERPLEQESIVASTHQHSTSDSKFKIGKAG
jgi:hypothetical protein